MNRINFLPDELRNNRLIKRSRMLSLNLTLLLVINLFLSAHIFYGEYRSYLNSKEAFKYKDKAKSVSLNISKPNMESLSFFEANISKNFDYNTVTISKDTIIIKFNLKNKNEFANCVNKIENINKCEIQYLVAPYEQNGNYEFEMGIEVLK